MCGINGFNWKDESLIMEMNKIIRHRGPDDEGILLNDDFSFGHVRLSILDLSLAGHQPMFYSKKKGSCSQKFNKNNVALSDLSIIYNGEIYNFLDMKEKLAKKNYVFTSKTDTEVILAAYMEYGFDCVNFFNGMWSFCIHDKRKGILFCSRDRFGVKPFHYYHQDNKFIFSSEIKGIFAHNIKRQLNEKILYEYLVTNDSDIGSESFFNNILRLDPGHYLIYDLKSKEIKLTKYYNLKKTIMKKRPETFKQFFEDSVRMRLTSDVEVSACLSGGLDSSAIVCQLKEIGMNKMETFSIIFPDDKVDESNFQTLVIEKTGFAHNKNTISITDFVNDLDDIIYYQEEPFEGLSVFLEYKNIEFVKNKNIKVLLDGQGADEILCGYHHFFALRFRELFLKFQWITLIKEMAQYYTEYKSTFPIQFMIASFLPRFGSYFVKRKMARYFNIEHVKLRTPMQILKVRNIQEHSLNQELFFSLPKMLRWGDRSSMRWGVELRAPFCDYRLVEKSISLDTKEKIANNITKIILRDSMTGIIPDRIRLRRDKIGFQSPDLKFLRTKEGQKLFQDMFNSESFQKNIYLKFDNIKKLYYQTLHKKKDHSAILWKILIFHKWHEKWID